MEAQFKPQDYEQKIYQFWEKKGYFTASINHKKNPFTVILPPPNANADLHLGHAMYFYEDVMIRFHKLKGDECLWLPGADHAGFETQYVFEKQLKKEGKSRFDYSQKDLYRMIWRFVMDNKGAMQQQLRRLGFALDWSREKFTLDPDVIRIVHQTFQKLYDDDLVYRGLRLVNYCTRCGTGFSDLEVNYVERRDPLYYLKYGPFVLATTRPETKFGDAAVAFHPGDKRYQRYEGKEIEIEGLAGKFKLKVIADGAIDPKFGTGIEKVTPAHDFLDFEIGQRHNLPLKQVIDLQGRLTALAGKFQGLKVNEARKVIVEELKKRHLLEKTNQDYRHRVGVCYKCGTVIEPLPIAQWYIKIKPLAQKALKAIASGGIKFYPSQFKKTARQWLKNFHDWNISRQIVWGIRIPAYYCQSRKQWFVSVSAPQKCTVCEGHDFIQDTDTFDTWFSSAQWPFVTLKTHGDDFFNYFYPTSVMETGWEILPWWVCRMMMIGLYATGKPPFKTVFLHGMVRDKKGQKMSKSRGNIVNPMALIDKYGADALRASLVFQTTEGGDIAFSEDEDKIRGMRNFTNKIWNIGRFIYLNPKPEVRNSKQTLDSKSQILQKLQKEYRETKKIYLKAMEKYQFSRAFGVLYEFLWHRFADYYLEALKDEVKSGKIETVNLLKETYFQTLVLLHPFMPYVTEAVWQAFQGEENSILDARI